MFCFSWDPFCDLPLDVIPDMAEESDQATGQLELIGSNYPADFSMYKTIFPPGMICFIKNILAYISSSDFPINLPA